MDRHLILFGGAFQKPIHADTALHGIKGANLLKMAMAGLDVPAGAIIPTHVIDRVLRDPDQAKTWLYSSIDRMLERLEIKPHSLVALRPSTVLPQPALKPTLLGFGQDDAVFKAQAELFGEDYALKKRIALITQYGELVRGIDPIDFEEAMEEAEDEGAEQAALLAIAESVYQAKTGAIFDVNRGHQVADAILAVVADWNSPRAVKHREINNIDPHGGLALVMQDQVLFGAYEAGLIGHAHSRNSQTGVRMVNGSWNSGLSKARPQPIAKDQPNASADLSKTLEQSVPELFDRLSELAGKLEATFFDAQSFEFVSDGTTLFVMSSDASKTGIKSALRIACDLVENRVATPEQALMRINPLALEALIHRTIDPETARDVAANGMGASPGAASGVLTLTAEATEKAREDGFAPILVRIETSPEDVVGMAAAEGIVTARGGLTSHAAVVARGMGKPCVTGVASLRVDFDAQTATMGGRVFKAGDVITIDGTLGEVMIGEVPTILPEISEDFATVLGWADRFRRLGVRANADTEEEARTARMFGATGIGLCRTEHMFFRADRIDVMREMILAANDETRKASLDKLGPMQRTDFEAMFKIMEGLPVTVRLLDPPLHEFLPSREHEFELTAGRLGIDVESLKRRVEAMRETNPMLGHRGCRLAISHPDILDMQSRAIFEAAMNVEDETGRKITPEIMVPFVCAAEEVRIVRARIEQVAALIETERGRAPNYTVGTMIELPRAALRADKIALECGFFSFGTNDLTQTTFGISRDDASPFMALYREQRVLIDDPFQRFDEFGAGELMRLACEKGRRANAHIDLGVCGEHGGEPHSIAFFNALGIDYVSCSPYRVPIARLAAAQAALGQRVKS